MRLNIQMFGGSIDFDYAQAESDLAELEAHITNIMDSLSKKITCESYSGLAQDNVTSMLASINAGLAKMEEPLTKTRNKIEEVKEAYRESEARINSSLSGTPGSRTDMLK